ncbi:asparagine synthetase B [Mucilaginibacter myungsuensis]|uniref:Asparagine synthetase B n=1 Tax=Mucilaginibacter myungsuensis TaxID=649104 RepID=A0A929PWW3_9SPHI|nr:asparagine synthetase B [Mucilaginibacter myungsuensis]MBE9662554.1 asparagine synthetase B [Mucilaginibacter myungsuensis]MDN3597974.1 asparagine synthetase B [Mucilaginibacter myungsuensis]
MKPPLKYLITVAVLLLSLTVRAASILIPMDDRQKDHLKSYGVAFWVLKNNLTVDWLLNYRGGSFMINYSKAIEDECKIRGISYEVLPDAQVAEITTQINDPSVNMDIVKLEKAPKVALYSPKSKGNLEDAVALVLKYAEIPYEHVYDERVLKGDLKNFDWVHLHHEDFTGQYSKGMGASMGGFRGGGGMGGFEPGFGGRNEFGGVGMRGGVGNTNRLSQEENEESKPAQEALAKKLGYKKVSKMKLDVARQIRDFCTNGGFLFAMCSGADSFDIALSAANTDIVDEVYDGDPPDPDAQSKLDFTQTLAFQNFNVVTGRSRRFSDIDVSDTRRIEQSRDFFTLFDFSAKWDAVPSMLTQDHDRVVKGFKGLATAFDKTKLKPGVTIMGEMRSVGEARYIHGEYGKGQWTFYGGHDPEDYQHSPNEPPTDLSLHPNSLGYRLILNNVLFPAAKKKKQKT